MPSRGGLDILINNAGVSMQGFDSSVARHTLDVNFFGALRVTDRLLPTMRPGGRIVMESSGPAPPGSSRLRSDRDFSIDAHARRADRPDGVVRSRRRRRGSRRKGWPSSAYRVSKVGLNALVRVLARELRDDPRRILVNAGSPGWTRTAMGGNRAPRSPAEGARTPVWLAMLPQGWTDGRLFRRRARRPPVAL